MSHLQISHMWQWICGSHTQKRDLRQLSCLKWSEVAQSCPTLCSPMDCSLPGLRSLSVHGIFQARVLEWAAMSFSRVSSWPRDWTWVSYIAGRRLTIWAPREAPAKMATIKDRNGMDLAEAEHTKKRWREYTEELDAWLKQRPRSRFCREEGWEVDTAAADWAGVMRVPAMCRRQGTHEHRVSSPRK